MLTESSGRMMMTSVADFPKLFKQTYDALQPGGWFELQDLYLPMLADDESMKGTAIQEWNDKFVLACDRMGRSSAQTRKYKDWMTQFGFERVHESVFKWPINSWPKDKEFKEMGRWNLINMLEGLDGFTMRLFTKALDMSFEEVATFLVEVRKDLYNKSIHCYWPMWVSSRPCADIELTLASDMSFTVENQQMPRTANRSLNIQTFLKADDLRAYGGFLHLSALLQNFVALALHRPAVPSAPGQKLYKDADRPTNVSMRTPPDQYEP